MIRNRTVRPTTRLRLEHLEDRSVLSTFTVNTTLDNLTAGDGKLTLREAITKANTTPGADTIVVPSGIYKIALDGAGESANATGDFDITDAVTIAGAGAGATIVDAQQKDRVFEVSGSGPVVIAGLTIRNGLVTGGPGDGGGIRAVMADLVVRDCAVVGNRASEFGGGISNDSLTGTGNVKVVRTTVARNVSGQNGGGIFLHNSVLTVTNSTIRLNVTGGSGGGIDATTATLTNSTVSGNTAGGSGGGLSAEIATLTNSTISGNSSQGSGGGINAIKATLSNTTVSGNFSAADGGGINFSNPATLTNCTISGNASSQRGGGINATTATLTNCTISGNSAVIEGGGVYSTTASLLNCTVVENTAGTGGGLFHVAGGTFSVRNTIVALNLVPFGGNGPDAFGAAFTSQGHNLIGDGTESIGFAQGVSGDMVGTSAIPIDPKLGPLQNNGGLTKTMALLTGSLAIDHGDNAILPPTDQRGLPRKKDGNFDGLAIVDIGSFEK